MEATIGAIAVGIGLVIAAVVAAWVSLRKSKTENDGAIRNGVINEWKEITDKLQDSHTKCVGRTKDLEGEVRELRLELSKMYGEISALRVQAKGSETERAEQRTEIADQRVEIRGLEKDVIQATIPNTEALAEAVVTKLAEALPTTPLDKAGSSPVKIEIVPASKPLPVKETPDPK